MMAIGCLLAAGWFSLAFFALCAAVHDSARRREDSVLVDDRI